MSEPEIREIFDRLKRVDEALKSWDEHHRRGEDAVHAIDLRLTRIEEGIALINETRKDHERRMRFVERWAWGIPPALIMALLALLERLWR